MKKKLFIVLTVLVLAFAFTACGQSEDSDKDTSGNQDTAGQDTEHMLVINTDPATVYPKDCDSRGFKYFIADASQTHTFTAVNKGDEEVTWNVYVMDEEFDDETRYISQSMDPSLEGDGELDIEKGQYIYVECSANDFTSDGGDLPEDSYLEINLK